MGKKTILLVEDDPSLQLTLRYLIEDMGYDLVVAQNHEQAAAALSGGPYAAAIVDYFIDNKPSSRLMADLKRGYPEMPLVCSTAASAQQVTFESDSAKPNAFLRKPFGANELRDTLHSLIGQSA
jgi:DNA-binding NtrC family response regulator